MKKSLLYSLFFLTNALFPQDPFYKVMMNNSQYNFYTVCDSADAYFKNREKGKGSGYIPYLRWKNNNSPLFYPTGNRNVDYYMPYNEFERIKNEGLQNSSQRIASSIGWTSLGPDTIGTITGHYAAGLGRVEFVEVNKTNFLQIYMGSRSGGLWRTNDEGSTWTHNTDFLPASGVNAISAAPTNFDSVLINVRSASNGTSFGIYRSIDGGVTFTQSPFNPINLGFGGLGSNFKINVIKYHPRVSNLVFVGTDRGIYRSTDNLLTWVRINTSWDVKDIEFHPINNNIIYVYENYYWGTNKNKIFKSTDQGISYNPLLDLTGNSNAQINISTSATCPNCIFASSNNGIWKSFDIGITFYTTLNPAPVGVSLWYATPNDIDTSKYVSGYLDLYRCSDGGLSFNQSTWWSLGSIAYHGGTNNQTAYNGSSVYAHADCNYLTCVNGNYYACTDGFLNKSSDNGLTWQKLSLTTGIRENYNLGLSQSNHARTICGSQDNGTSIKKENGWTEFYGADGMECLIHPLNDKWMLGSFQFGGRRRTFDGGLTQDGFTPNSGAYWIAPMFYNPNNHMTIYSLSQVVHRSNDFGNTWSALGSPTTFTNAIQYASIAENNTDIMAITNEDKIELSVNGGVSFTNIKNTLPSLYISDVVFDPNDDATIIVTYSNYQNNGQKVFITHNSGSTWQNITFNLGNMPIESVVIDHTDSSNIYVGAAIGVYKKSMNATIWTLYNPNLPNVTIKELEINYGSNTLRAATWGRGLWEYNLADRANYPSIIKTEMSSEVTFDSPKTTVPQFVTSQITYTGTLTSVFVRWAINTPTFTIINSIPMSLVSGTTWKSNLPLPNFPAGTKVFFKVFAIGSSLDTSVTYKFMYELKPYVYCNGSGTNVGGNLFIDRLRCSNIDNNFSGNTTNSYFSTLPITVYRDSTYTIIGNFNTSWPNNDFIAWIDYDNDATFSAGERIVFDPNTGALGTGTFVVPNTAVEDTVKMRVRLGYWGPNDSNDPCGTTLGEVEDYPVIIRQVPMISFTGSTTFCVGSAINLSYSGTFVDSVKWVLSSSLGTYSYTGNTINTNTLTVGTYSILLTGYKYANAYTKNYPNYFTIHTLPTVTVNSGTICSGNSFTISPSGALTYTYSGGSAIISPIISTSYTITGTNMFGCVNSNTAISSVSVNISPTVNVITSNSLLCEGESAILTANGATNYTWNTGATTASISVAPIVTTVYTVSGTDANGCKDIATIIQNVNACTNIISNENFKDIEIDVFPNPNSGIIQINFNNSIDNIEIQITNLLGEIMFLETTSNQLNTYNISKLANSIYFITINYFEYKKTFKIVKHD